jgi:hypothetical protein
VRRHARIAGAGPVLVEEILGVKMDDVHLRLLGRNVPKGRANRSRAARFAL